MRLKAVLLAWHVWRAFRSHRAFHFHQQWVKRNAPHDQQLRLFDNVRPAAWPATEKVKREGMVS